MTSYLEHPLLKSQAVEKRLFQMDLAAKALQSSTLVVVPTGLGKTVIALMVLLPRLERGKVLFLAPTRPLVEQHAEFLKRVLNDADLAAFVTGETPPDKRAEIWDRSRVVVSTPQVIENDLLSHRIDLKDVSLIIFDEAHRGVGNYAYVYIAERYAREAKDPLVLGITASPGSQSEKIEEICSNLGIERIQTKTEEDPDVQPFVHHREIEWVKVKVPDQLLAVKGAIEGVLRDRIDDLNHLGILPVRVGAGSSKRELLELQSLLRGMAARQPNSACFQGVSVMAEVLKLNHAVELAETQGKDALCRYFDRLRGEALSRSGSKASRRIMEDPRFRQAMTALLESEVEHPKLAAARELLREQLAAKPDSRIMVFTNYRDTASAVLEYLKEDPEIRAVRFVGQSSRQDDLGLSQKKQGQILDKFRSGEYNVLIATSVGEEGIDIPATDMVLFYEPVPSEIRSIQRKGRTGRARAGRVVVLMARGTRDEAYYWISDRKEKTMQKQIRGLSSTASAGLDELSSRQTQIAEDQLCSDKETGQAARILVDSREREMGKLLESLGLDITLKNLEVGDYVLSERLAVERKTAEDFAASIIDPERNLFRQVRDLSRTYEKPVMILEGRNLYGRQISPASIQGALASIAIDYRIPIIPTESLNETAQVLAVLAAREHKEGREPKLHGHKTARTLKEQQEYLISAIPSVGPAVARNLLKHFGSVQKVLSASQEELEEVEMVGKKIAERIRELAGSEYKG